MIQLIINYSIVSLIIIIGLIVTLTDFRESRIKNKYIKLGIYIGLIYYIILFFITVLSRFYALSYYFPPQYYLFILINTLIGFILAFILWNLKLWAGGDAKLFTLYVFLIPLFFYSEAYLPFFPAINLLINIIIPIFIYLLIKMLIYPISLFISHLKNPKLVKEYFKKHREQNKFDKSKIKEYLNSGLSFLLILIFFQLLRNKVNEFLDPYLGNMVYATYFFMGFVIFKPLRVFLKEKVLLVLIGVSAYFIISYFYFHEQVFAELHKVFALQMIFMMSYFYIFKYGRALGQFLYNSAEVKMVPVEELSSGNYINKGYIRKIMGNRNNLDNFKQDIENVLSEEEHNNLAQLIEEKVGQTGNEKKQYKIISVFRNLRPESAFKIAKQIFEYKKQKKQRKELLETVKIKLNDKQNKTLDNILNNNDDIDNFLKKIKGKLSEEQALRLKSMIEERNKEVEDQGLEPIKHIILHKTFSFAPFMLLGVIITLLTKSSIIHLIYEYILHR
ncbi:MAG: hypothetical protein GF365_00755 [Candidatus Buchananbacteria bacterium]|nr:hypothetical protein [Candidatus Buchananbacteria bacterium]